ncbi:putative zinc finger CCCH domain-containing protein 32-like isoform X1 [Capsicum annuum]|uniref:potassium channel SKOR-like n=1 Tax=Capsicum annuum TaxID=4072 RepID=UPI001FB053C2|nr:potassium channel SKOR-like [Capsicum annuum]KAF3681490.1 putative zinc finger CCCH domain-containing protein 32-like isoform X1 [Capsicum annuum]KAF3683654.1 putative zinc finger CCCH domain-containing protein 32-like isoform X1 [Capsicum annuum]
MVTQEKSEVIQPPTAVDKQLESYSYTNWAAKIQEQYQKIKENAETYPYVWGSYIVVYGGFGLWFTYRWRRLRKTVDRVQVLQERLCKLVQAEESTNKFGNMPLLEAIKGGHDRVASLLVKGVLLNIKNADSFLYTVIAKGDSNLLRKLLSNGVDPNTKDYDHRMPLHVAATQGQYSIAKLLLGAGASVFSKDRWENTPVDEARVSGNKQMISLLEEAKSAQLSEFPDVPHENSMH